MTALMTTATWKVVAGRETEFVQAWTTFARWASSQPGATTLRLGRDVVDSQRFVSYGEWDDVGSVRAWKSAPDFPARMARVMQFVDEFRPAELDVVSTVETEGAPR